MPNEKKESNDHYSLAIGNISKYGDTDIFPFPIENVLFYDNPQGIKKLLLEINSNFDKWISSYPVDSIKTCIPVGHTGYRWATLIDPLWNAYLLAQVLKIADSIESSRLAIDKKSVFSYRIKLDYQENKLFDRGISWRLFYNTALEISEDFSYVVKFDISDFYTRVYHHRLENALRRTSGDPEAISRIMKILQDLSINVSYGLPIGGNAARILAEILLNSMDQMLTSKRIRFCRFVDDYIVFASSKEDAYRKLNWCADFLLKNEGLALQKSKTQIQTKSEFVSHVKASLEGEEGESSKERASFLRLNIHYDPYSLSASSDYAELKNKIDQFDIAQLIKSEVKKSRIHQAFGKQLLNAISFLEKESLDLAFNVISSNLEVLYPIFPSVMQVTYKMLLKCSTEVKNQFINELCRLIIEDSYMIQTDNNASYVVRVLSLVNTENTIQAIDQVYSESSSQIVKANCIYAMVNLRNDYWLSNLKFQFSTLSKWERRAFISASFFLGDEGKHWRQNTSSQFTDLEVLLKDWISTKHPIQNSWKLPL